jgi:hypothetical protein
VKAVACLLAELERPIEVAQRAGRRSSGVQDGARSGAREVEVTVRRWSTPLSRAAAPLRGSLNRQRRAAARTCRLSPRGRAVLHARASRSDRNDLPRTSRRSQPAWSGLGDVPRRLLGHARHQRAAGPGSAWRRARVARGPRSRTSAHVSSRRNSSSPLSTTRLWRCSDSSASSPSPSRPPAPPPAARRGRRSPEHGEPLEHRRRVGSRRAWLHAIVDRSPACRSPVECRPGAARALPPPCAGRRAAAHRRGQPSKLDASGSPSSSRQYCPQRRRVAGCQATTVRRRDPHATILLHRGRLRATTVGASLSHGPAGTCGHLHRARAARPGPGASAARLVHSTGRSATAPGTRPAPCSNCVRTCSQVSSHEQTPGSSSARRIAGRVVPRGRGDCPRRLPAAACHAPSAHLRQVDQTTAGLVDLHAGRGHRRLATPRPGRGQTSSLRARSASLPDDRPARRRGRAGAGAVCGGAVCQLAGRPAAAGARRRAVVARQTRPVRPSDGDCARTSALERPAARAGRRRAPSRRTRQGRASEPALGLPGGAGPRR